MILNSLDDVNWAAVGVSAVAALAIGLVWFAPQAFGRFWARHVSRYTGLPAADITSAAAPRLRWRSG